MRFLPLLALLLTGCSATQTARLPWNSRAQEQQRLNAATEPGPRTEEAILNWDPTKQFNPSAANFARSQTVSTKTARSNEFLVPDEPRTKTFTTGVFGTRSARDSGASYTTKGAPVKESWFSRLAMGTKSYSTKQSPDAERKTETRPLPGGDRAFLARGRRQAALDSKGAAGMPMGGDRTGGESWSGDLKPLTIQDIRTLLNKN